MLRNVVFPYYEYSILHLFNKCFWCLSFFEETHVYLSEICLGFAVKVLWTEDGAIAMSSAKGKVTGDCGDRRTAGLLRRRESSWIKRTCDWLGRKTQP